MLNEFVKIHRELEECKIDIEHAFILMRECYCQEGKIIIAGNGGSSSDAEHIVGELMKGFVQKRELRKSEKEVLLQIDSEKGEYLAEHLQGALPAISLSSHTSLMTAITNDIGGEYIFAQQVHGYGKKEDVLLAISTSGSSKNVVMAAIVAKSKGMKVISLTGSMGGELFGLSDVCIRVPAKETFIIQESHVMIYHLLCRMLEESFFVTES